MRIDCPRALSQITSLNSGGRDAKSPRVRGVGARLLVWARCFDLPFRGVAAIHIGLDRQKQNGPGSPPAAPSRLPPCRCGTRVSQLCSCVCSCPLLALLGPSPFSLEIGRPTVGSVLTVDTRYFAYCSRTTFLHSMYAGIVQTVAIHAMQPIHLGTPVYVTGYARRNTGTGTGTRLPR